MKVHALVVDWNRPADTVQALRSLDEMRPGVDGLICVENGSTTSNQLAIRAGAPEKTFVIEMQANIGFAGAVNIGMASAVGRGADWVLLLNNDATVSKDCLRLCLDATGDGRVAAVSPAISFATRPDRLWYGGGLVSHHFAFTRHRALLGPSNNPPPSGRTQFCTGCCMLICVEAWISVGPFRSDFFAYYEDAEWSQRAQAAGWRCEYVGAVLCQHTVSASSEQQGSLGLTPSTAYYLARNPLRFALDSKPRALRLSRLVGLLTVWSAYNAIRIVRSRKWSVCAAYISGLQDAFMGRMGPRNPVSIIATPTAVEGNH